MQLTAEERNNLDGNQGEVVTKVRPAIVSYGEVFGAECMLPLDASTHVITSLGMVGLEPGFALMMN